MSLSGNCGDNEKGLESCWHVRLKDQIAPAANNNNTKNAGLNARVGVPSCPLWLGFRTTKQWFITDQDL